jgi:hypothetical protein
MFFTSFTSTAFLLFYQPIDAPNVELCMMYCSWSGFINRGGGKNSPDRRYALAFTKKYFYPTIGAPYVEFCMVAGRVLYMVVVERIPLTDVIHLRLRIMTS